MGKKETAKRQRRVSASSRLFDRVVASPELAPELRALFSDATVVAGDAVAEYYFAGTDQEAWDVRTDFPTLAPPLPILFVEFRAPSRIVSAQEGMQDWGDMRPSAWGVLMCASEVFGPWTDPEAWERTDQELERVGRELAPLLERARELGDGDVNAGLAGLPWTEQQMLRSFASRVHARRRYEDEAQRAQMAEDIAAGRAPRWGVEALLFAEYRTRSASTLWRWDYCVRPDGALHPMSADAWCRQGPSAPDVEQMCLRGGEKAFDDLSGMFSPLLHCALLTVSFMHCKNVTLRNVDPVAEWRAQQRKTKGYSPVLVRYKVLEIEPMKQVLRHEGRSEQLGLRKALHICRGHFADYTEGKGLFGKYHGRYWVPMHVRGRPEQGAVLKDYRVLEPHL